MAEGRGIELCWGMSNQHFYQDQNQKPSGAARPAAGGELNQNKIDLHPAPYDVAARAYSHYEKGGFRHGFDMDHWLNAEAELLAERNRTRTHGYPGKK